MDRIAPAAPRLLPPTIRTALWPATFGLAVLMSSAAFAAPDQAAAPERNAHHHRQPSPREDREIAYLLDAPASPEPTRKAAPAPEASPLSRPSPRLGRTTVQEDREIADLLAPAAEAPPPQQAALPQSPAGQSARATPDPTQQPVPRLGRTSVQEDREIADLLAPVPIVAPAPEATQAAPQAPAPRAAAREEPLSVALIGPVAPSPSPDNTAAVSPTQAALTVQRPTPAHLETIASAAIVPQLAVAEPSRPQVLQAVIPPSQPAPSLPQLLPPPQAGSPAQQARPATARPNAVKESILLESGNGRILALPMPAANVFVADPKVAEVRPASTNSLFVFGVGAGRTTIAAMDTEGRAVAQFEVTVRPSTFAAVEAEGAVSRLIPNSHIHVTPQARGLLLTGTVGSPADSARAVSILRGYLPKDDPIENQMIVQSAIQINLRVRVVEMQRNVTRALGVDWQALGSFGQFATTNGLGGLGSAAAGFIKGMGNTNIPGLGRTDINAVIDSLAQDNLLRVLAEPNLTVMSGQPGSFLAGGEFPIPVAQSAATAAGGVPTISVVFKRYGVSLDFVPTVMSDGRINLHLAPEVSQLTTQGAVTLSSGSSGGVALSIPGVTVRRTETTVELGSGQSFAIAGLLQDNVTQTTNGLPFLGDLPVLGALFRSSAYQRQETELVFIITPYIVRPVDDPATLRTGNDRFSPPNDLERILLLRQTGRSGVTQANAVPGAGTRIPGAAGFIVQ